MVTTWTLVVFVIASYSGTPTVITAIPGFLTQEACVEAAMDVREFASSAGKESHTRCYPTRLPDGAKK